jgi:hypothetical protein
MTAGLREALAGFEPGVFSGPDCARLAEELTATANACTAASTMAARRAIDAGAQNSPSWFARQSGSTPGQARQALDAAKSIEDMPDTKAALLAGQISMPQAVELAQAEAEHPGAEQAVLDIARSGDLRQVKDGTRQYKQSHTSVEDLHAQQLAATDFRSWTDRLGMTRFAGALPPEWGVPLTRHLKRQALRLHRDARQTGQTNRPFPFYQAQALGELAAGSPTEPEPRTHRNVDLVIVCDLFAWRRGHTHPGEVCHIIDGGPIPVEVAKELTSDDPFLKAVLHDGTNIHTVNHFGRHIPETLRTALDLGPLPAFTGRACDHCGQRWGLEYDHIDPVANGGPTSYANLRGLCWDDHLEKTEQDRQAGLLGPHARARPPNGR